MNTTNNYTFLRNNFDDGDSTTYVVNGKFDTFAACQVMDSNGQPENDCLGEEDFDCKCDTVTAYEFWNGSNRQHIVVSAGNYDAPYSIVDQPEEVKRLNKILEAALDGVWEETNSTGKHIQVDGAVVTLSYYESHFALYGIDED